MEEHSLGKRFVLALVRHRMVCIAIALLILGAGYWAMRHIPLDSFPDITPVRVEVDTEVDGMAAEEVEKLVTFPIEQALRGIPNSETVQSESKFSLSVVEVKFKSGTDLYWARSQVFENLSNASLPPGVQPQMAPMDEGTGQIYIYTLTSHKLDDMQLRTLQDFLVKPQLRVVAGVADVPMFGGFVKQFQVVLNPNRLASLNLSIDDVTSALNNNNSSVGGNYLNHGSMQYVIRGIGFVKSLDDIRRIVIATPNGVPIHLGDVAEVRIGAEDRQGAVSVDGQGEVVAGIVLKRLGENTAEVISAVQARLAEIQKTLASGRNLGLDTRDVKVVTLYDQSYLIRQSVHTVSRSLVEGAILIIAILLLFIGSFTASLIPIFANLFCIAVAFYLMKASNVSANLLSLGGLALSLGMMVDATVMILENVYRHLQEVDHGNEPHEEVVADAVAEILKPTLLAVLVIMAVFVPVLTLQGIEGQLFIPLALAVLYSMVGSLLMAVGVAPGLCDLVLRYNPNHHHGPNRVTRLLQHLYEGPLRFAVANPWLVVLVCVGLMVVSVITFAFTGSEFLPPLEEGNFRIRLTFPPSMSLPYAMDVTNRIERRILQVLPEATEVVSYVGRPELGGDPESLSNDEVYVRLKPQPEWPLGVTKADMENTLRRELQGLPGTTIQFSQELEMRTDEMISGFNTPITVYVLGDDAKDLVAASEMVKKVMEHVPGTADVGVEHLDGIDNLDVIPDRARMARYGASVANVLDVVQAAVGGATAGQVYLQNQRFDIVARVEPGFRRQVETIGRLLVNTGSGARIPLKDLATIRYDVGFDHVDRYNGMRRIVVMSDVQGRSVGSVVDDAKARIEQLKLPPGITLYWGGQAEEASHAFETLSIAVPAALLVVFLLIYLCFDNLVDTLIVLSSIPLGIAGGTFLLMIMHLHLNVPAYIGFIAKFGIAVQNGMIMVSYMNTLRRNGMTSREAAISASLTRLRPELLSALIGSIGLVPFLLAAGTGATVERPLAAVVIGGVIVSRPMAWFLLPALYAWWKKDAVEPQ